MHPSTLSNISRKGFTPDGGLYATWFIKILPGSSSLILVMPWKSITHATLSINFF